MRKTNFCDFLHTKKTFWIWICDSEVFLYVQKMSSSILTKQLCTIILTMSLKLLSLSTIITRKICTTLNEMLEVFFWRNLSFFEWNNWIYDSWEIELFAKYMKWRRHFEMLDCSEKKCEKWNGNSKPTS